MDELHSGQIEFVSNLHSDAGGSGVKITCPVCSDVITVFESTWWDRHCKCGYYWDVIGVGSK